MWKAKLNVHCGASWRRIFAMKISTKVGFSCSSLFGEILSRRHSCVCKDRFNLRAQKNFIIPGSRFPRRKANYKFSFFIQTTMARLFADSFRPLPSRGPCACSLCVYLVECNYIYRFFRTRLFSLLPVCFAFHLSRPWWCARWGKRRRKQLFFNFNAVTRE
jgi:hypothetical protein